MIKTISLSIIIAMSVAIAPPARALEISQIKLRYLQTVALDADKQLPVNTGETLDVEDIWLHHLALKQLLNSPYPTAEERNWVVGLTKDANVLTMANPDHPNQELLIVDLAQQAQATLAYWQMQRHTAEFDTRHQLGAFSWHDATASETQRKALKHWLSGLNEDELHPIAESYINYLQANDSVDNSILAVLAEKTQSSTLISIMLRRSADEYSYQLLQKLPTIVDNDLAIEQLLIATENQQLFSQSLTLLLRHYSYDQRVQDAYMLALDNAQQQWIAAALAITIKDSGFIQYLQQGYMGKSDDITRFVLEQIRSAN